MDTSYQRSSAPSTPRIAGASFYSASTTPSTFSKKSHTQHPVFRANFEENTTRKTKVKDFIKEFQSQLTKMQDNGIKRLSLKQQAKASSETLYKFLSDVLALYNVSIRVISLDQSDSAMQIEPVLQPGKTIQIMMCITAIISRFPYSFIKMIDLNQFTICKYFQLKKEGHESIYNNRILTNAMFSVDEHNTFDKIQRQFYKVLLFHIEKRTSAIHDEWPLERTVKVKPLLEGTKSSFAPSLITHLMKKPSLGLGGHTRSSSLGGKEREKFVNLDDVKNKEKNETFYRIMTNPRDTFGDENPRLQCRARFLKDKLECIDPVGINQEWWDELEQTDFLVFEALLGHFF